MASVTLGSKAVGDIVKIKINGSLKNFIVVHQGNPSENYYSVNADGTWLLMQGVSESVAWDADSNTGEYAVSDVNAYCEGTFFNSIDANIRSRIKQIRIEVQSTSKLSQTKGEYHQVFILSAAELNAGPMRNGAGGDSTWLGTDLAYFSASTSTALDNKRKVSPECEYWTRGVSICKSSGSYRRICYTSVSGGVVGLVSNSIDAAQPSVKKWVRPAFVLPDSLLVDDSGAVSANTAPTTPSALTVPATIHGGSTVTLEWTASSDAENNLEGYTVERSLDGGSTWAQIYQGSARTATNTVAFGTETVMYRVRAYDAEGLHSGWKTSGQVAVINNTAPTPPDGITVPEAVNGGRPLTISWGASADGENNLSGYNLERQVDGGEWEAVYTGPELSFTDQVTKGWQTVAYRVRAYDTENAYSGYTAGEARAVNNNTPPEITCEYPANTSLGVKTEGFSVPYSVADEEGDPVSVTEAVDGVTLRTFAAQLGEAYSFELDGADFMKVLNGSHTLSITAQDGASGTTHSLTFTKRVTKAAVTLAQPMEADGPISVCVLSVSGSIPADAAYTVEVSNNAKDEAPAWEDCTEEIRTGANHIFTNDAAANGPAFSFRLSVERGESGQGGYISSVQGGFQ